MSNASYQRAWRARNAELVKELNKAYYAANKESVLAQQKEYYARTAERRRAYSVAWNKANPERKKATHRLYLYGLTQEHYEFLLREQGERCAICLSDDWGARGPKVDHDHETGAVRGLLCNHCNLLLGHAGDDVEKLRSAIKYLER
jgi:Recombination endonuclease VII